MSSIWHVRPTVEIMQETHENTMVAHLGIAFTEIGDDFVAGRMPADNRTSQPMGIVHGGASVVLAETLGSAAANWVVDRDLYRALGQEVNANHLRPAKSGWVTGVARPIHLGRRSQVWGIELTDDNGKLTCISRLTMAVVELATLR
ncbi:MAG: hotdog fold thioesterase [Pseudomonadota bacterium]